MAVPAVEGEERYSACEGSWLLEPGANGGTHVVYWSAADPGDSAPTWLANLSAVNQIPLLFTALAHRAHDPHWLR